MESFEEDELTRGLVERAAQLVEAEEKKLRELREDHPKHLPLEVILPKTVEQPKLKGGKTQLGDGVEAQKLKRFWSEYNESLESSKDDPEDRKKFLKESKMKLTLDLTIERDTALQVVGGMRRFATYCEEKAVEPIVKKDGKLVLNPTTLPGFAQSLAMTLQPGTINTYCSNLRSACESMGIEKPPTKPFLDAGN